MWIFYHIVSCHLTDRFKKGNNRFMTNLFDLLVLALSLTTAVLSYNVYTVKSGAVKNIAVYVMVAAVVMGVSQLVTLAGVVDDGSVIKDILDQSGVVSAVMLLLVILELSKLKK